MSALIVFILYNRGVQLKKFSPRPVNVGFLYVFDMKLLFTRDIDVSRNGKVLLDSISIVNLILGCLLFKYSRNNLA